MKKAYLSLGSTRSRPWDEDRKASLFDLSGRETGREGMLIKQVTPMGTWGFYFSGARGNSANTCISIIPPERRGGWSIHYQFVLCSWVVLSPEDINCRAPLAVAGVRANLKTKKCRLWQLEVRQRSPNGEGESLTRAASTTLLLLFHCMIEIGSFLLFFNILHYLKLTNITTA